MTWDRILFLSTHGVMRTFNLNISGILANGSSHHLYHEIQFDDALNSFVANVTHLFPATVYTMTLDGCTTPGCGPNTTISQRTNELGIP